MRKILRVLSILILIIIVGVAGLLTYVEAALPDVGPAPAFTVESTPELVKRGEYLANHVNLCIDCHSKRDHSYWSAPLIPGTLGQGGEAFTQDMGFPGQFYARNISPSHLSNWTDGEIFRTITVGVDKSNEAVFSIMPWENYGKMDSEDIKAVIAYLRTLPSQTNEPPKSDPDFPMNFILNTLPHEAASGTRPSPSNQIEYGAYMVNAAGCGICHTRQEKGKIVGEPYAGGFEFRFPDGSKAISANITPDKETGIGNWSEAAFINKFKQYADTNYRPVKLKPGDAQTVMAWTMYAGMDSTDIKAIYAYLKTLKPVNNKVISWKPKS